MAHAKKTALDRNIMLATPYMLGTATAKGECDISKKSSKEPVAL